MGDLMHALPALTEAKEHVENISFDWVVDTNFSSVPSWHPLVNKIITTDHRNWKKQLFSVIMTVIVGCHLSLSVVAQRLGLDLSCLRPTES